MDKKQIPEIFRQLQSGGYIKETDVFKTRDGFRLIYKSLAEILATQGIHDFPGANGSRLACANFYDDWFLYALPHGSDYVYSLFKLREQEHDAQQGAPADGDTPGVTISFISFDCQMLLNCLENPVDENRLQLDGEINRVVARRKQRHHQVLKRYFVNPASEGAYLVAETYVKHIAALAREGFLNVPQHYRALAKQYEAGKHSPKVDRLPRFLESVNQEAGYTVCDNEKIYIQDPANPDRYACSAILATHTGNTSLFSFAAEVEYHARFLIPIARFRVPLIGKSVYESAIRADMSVGDTEFQGPAPFYRPESTLVTRQYNCHKDSGMF